ncbi:rod shape-determining protein MreD [Flavobacterium alvei]|uniref:Rod shape-determining protein MreD n=1 Tax=Flavobacterium alvei TaxID=2080416 RepID=A0A2S5ADA8_9FLAO|nr:rod shape-determining protein MreD [Flavobacterium alvei]POY40402.1 rod shape-determining protein MreD [Flavobacterium alvei]HQF47774.1 rod shape-determining protein MreD [Flavobacterium alvei]HQK39874.1 rod shape-determining protein MreD [Flavobacterium alvei]
MNSVLFVNIFRFIILLTVQIIIFNNMNFWGFISPYPYILFIILYPVNGNKSGLLAASFLLGLMMDLFSNSGGFNTAACVILAYYRPYLFKFSFGLSYEYQTIKLNDVLTPERFSFLLLSVLIHHLILFTLEAFKFTLLLDILLRTVLSTIFTLLICIIIIYLTKPNRR